MHKTIGFENLLHAKLMITWLITIRTSLFTSWKTFYNLHGQVVNSSVAIVMSAETDRFG